MIDCHLRIHVGIANHFLFSKQWTNNLANIWNNEDQFTKEGYLQSGGRKQCQHAASAMYAVGARPSFSWSSDLQKTYKKHSSLF
jgi:hypothetical protein